MMRTIERPTPEPAELGELKQGGGEDFGSLASALDRAFRGVCAYCERQPLWRAEGDGLGALDTDLPATRGVLFTCDHFRPRHLICNASPNVGQCQDNPPPHSPDCPIYHWDNLVYACQPCNSVKGGQWPKGTGPAASYIDPCAREGRSDDPTSVFDYDLDSGEIKVRTHVAGTIRANAQQTICDLALNKDRNEQEAAKRNAGIRRVRLAELRQRHVQDVRRLLASSASIVPHLLPVVVASVVSPTARFSSISRQLVEETAYRRYLI